MGMIVNLKKSDKKRCFWWILVDGGWSGCWPQDGRRAGPSDEGPDTAGDGEAKWAVDVSVGMWKFQKVGTVAKEINVK